MKHFIDLQCKNKISALGCTNTFPQKKQEAFDFLPQLVLKWGFNLN